MMGSLMFLFFARCNIIRASRETKKEIMSYRKEIRSRICVCIPSYVIFVAILMYFPTPIVVEKFCFAVENGGRAAPRNSPSV